MGKYSRHVWPGNGEDVHVHSGQGQANKGEGNGDGASGILKIVGAVVALVVCYYVLEWLMPLLLGAAVLCGLAWAVSASA
jgi:hypothetical protein